MNKKISFWMLGIAAMLASCSQDELLQVPTADGETSTVTLTAQIDHKILTRATHDEDDATTRCLLAVYDAGTNTMTEGYKSLVEGTATENGYTFNLTLKDGQNYDFVFWADDESYDEGGNLTSISANNQLPGVAYYGSLTNTPLSSNMTVTLTHAVAKVTLKTTGALTADDKVTIKCSTASWFNAKNGDCASVYTVPLIKTITCPELDNGGEVYTFYTLAPKEGTTQDITISYNGNETTLSNVPLQMNYRTVLSGDVTTIGKVTGAITADIDKDWEESDKTVDY